MRVGMYDDMASNFAEKLQAEEETVFVGINWAHEFLTRK